MNLLPCTDNVDDAVMDTARDIIRDSVPPGYNLQNVLPSVTLASNPHRWIATFTCNDNNYEFGCTFLTTVKSNFKRHCPQGCTIKTVSLMNVPNGRYISVEILVNCMHNSSAKVK